MDLKTQPLNSLECKLSNLSLEVQAITIEMADRIDVYGINRELRHIVPHSRQHQLYSCLVPVFSY